MEPETKTENRNFTCSNPKCGRAFANPIIVQNLRSEGAASYCACPHCLTEIKETLDDKGRRLQNKSKSNEFRQVETLSVEKKPTLTPSKTDKCFHHFGYLSQITGVKETPDECMVCEKLIECKLWKFDSTPPRIESENVEPVKQPAKEDPVKEKPVEEPAKIEPEKQPVEVTVQEAASDRQRQQTEESKEKQKEGKKHKRWLLDSIKFPK